MPRGIRKEKDPSTLEMSYYKELTKLQTDRINQLTNEVERLRSKGTETKTVRRVAKTASVAPTAKKRGPGRPKKSEQLANIEL